METQTLSLILRGPGTRLSGYPYFWIKAVSGCNPKFHCHRALVGRFLFGKGHDWTLGESRTFDVPEGVVLYVCGVSHRGWSYNLHAALVPEAGAAAITLPMVDGQELIVLGARQLEIPPLPLRWAGLDKSFTTCRNFQFAVHHYHVTEEQARLGRLSTPSLL